MGFKVDFVNVNLFTDGLPCGFKKTLVGHACNILSTDIGRNLEILVVTCLQGDTYEG